MGGPFGAHFTLLKDIHMPGKDNKPRSKVLQSWNEIKDLSQYIKPGDPVVPSEKEIRFQEKANMMAGMHRTIEKTAPREDMRRAGAKKAREWEKSSGEMAMARARTLLNRTRQRKREAEDK